VLVQLAIKGVSGSLSLHKSGLITNRCVEIPPRCRSIVQLPSLNVRQIRRRSEVASEFSEGQIGVVVDLDLLVYWAALALDDILAVGVGELFSD